MSTKITKYDIVVGEKIRKLRNLSGLSQLELAAAVGISQGHISMIENGRRRLDKELAKPVADAVGVHPDTILSRDDYGSRELSILRGVNELIRLKSNAHLLAIEALIASATKK